MGRGLSSAGCDLDALLDRNSLEWPVAMARQGVDANGQSRLETDLGVVITNAMRL